MSIQIVKQIFGKDGKTYFVYTDQKIICDNIQMVLKDPSKITKHLSATETANIYYTLAHHNGAEDSDKAVRSAATFDYQTVFATDIDGADGTLALRYAECVGQVFGCTSDQFIVIASGNGVHVIANLKKPIRSVKWFDDNRAAHSEYLDKVNKLLAEASLPGKADSKIFDPARVLRLPNTINSKPGKGDKPCTLVQYTDALLDIDLKKATGFDKLEQDNIPPIEVRRQYPTPDYPEIITRCGFLQHCINKPQELHEPDVFDCFSLLTIMPEHSKALINDESKSPEELALYIYDQASNGVSQSLRRIGFEEKWAQSGKYGARKCETICNNGFKGCLECPYFGKIQTPLAIKGTEHLSSKDNGFWILNAKGIPTKPHYNDLVMEFNATRQTQYLADQKQWMKYNGQYYTLANELEIKGFVDSTMNPSDSVVEAHRNEFIKNAQIKRMLTKEQEAEFYTHSIAHRLNCKNGVVNVLTNEIEPHSPRFGFTSVLQYSYEPHQYSAFFLDWLAEITQYDADIMNTIIDVMAYCIYPSYDDHVLTYLTGTGQNGKSTLLKVIKNIIGANNYSTVSISQLTQHRFAPAQLQNKLVNLSDENSGESLSLEQINILKNLSDGGELTVERKGQHPFDMRNTAKLIFSSNTPPKFCEQGDAVRRRLLVIPFNYKIPTIDPTMEDKLFQEAPKILSMLIKRIQDNLKINNGKFIINRDTAVLHDAQENMLSIGNTVKQWSAECLIVDASQDLKLPVSDAYASYVRWCEDSGIKTPQNKNNFSKNMVRCVPNYCEPKFVKINGKTHRVYQHIKLNEV